MLRLLTLVFCIAALISSPVIAREDKGEAWEVDGWHEAVVTVRQLSDYHTFFLEIAQWKMLESGKVSKQQLSAWGLPDSASARYQVFSNPGTARGAIRLLEFSGVAQDYIRPDDQSWDTGGIFDINMRVKDLSASAEKMRQLGWQARAPITQFEFGPFEVREWIVRSPDGLQIAFIQRLKPELTGWPHFKAMSRAFNSTQVVKDLDASMNFYENVLGFKRLIEHKGASKKPGPNVLGVPTNYTSKIEREVYVLHPDKRNDGSLELLKFHGFDGIDHSQKSHFPNLGINMLRFPVNNIEKLQAHLKQNESQIIHAARLVDGIKRMTVSAPEGAWLEFYEVTTE